VTGPKFSPRRATHNHYVPNTIELTTSGEVSTLTGGTLATSTYAEACRLIRVDGIFRVAVDPYGDRMDLLQTNSDASGNVQGLPTVPPATAAALIPSSFRYAGPGGFVLTYMANRFVTPGSSTTAATYNNASLGGTPALPLRPDLITIRKDDVIQRWHHLRGLYVDFLEADAVSRINTAKAECEAANAEASGSCDLTSKILPLVPFTSINLTEIAEWRVFRQTQTGNNNNISFTTPYFEDDDYTHLFTANNDFLASLTETNPVRGAVETGVRLPTSNCSGQTCTPIEVRPKVHAQMFYSNSGLALLAEPVHLDEVIRSDVQNYYLRDGNPDANAGSFKITIPKVTNQNPNGYTFSASTAAYPKFSGTPTVRCSFATKGGAKPNPFTCVTKGLNNPLALTAAKYNYQEARSVTGSLSCTSPDGPAITRTGTYTANFCRNFQVTSVNPLAGRTITVGAAQNDGAMNETTRIDIAPLTNGDSYTLNLQPQPLGDMGTQVDSICTYITVSGSPVYTIVPGNCP
jgi:hypothetical protein